MIVFILSVYVVIFIAEYLSPKHNRIFFLAEDSSSSMGNNTGWREMHTRGLISSRCSCLCCDRLDTAISLPCFPGVRVGGDHSMSIIAAWFLRRDRLTDKFQSVKLETFGQVLFQFQS